MTKQAEDGRFIVKLPFKQPQRALSDSFVQAKRRFLSLERRLTANPQLHEKYSFHKGIHGLRSPGRNSSRRS